MQPQMPGDQVSPNSNPNPSPNPVVMPAGVGVPITPQRPGKRKLMMIAGAAAVFVAALAAYAFAYYLPNKPENVWRSALDRTSRGYERLVDYLGSDELSKRYETTKLEGEFAYEAADFATDGSIDLHMDDKSATFSGDVGLGLTRLNVDGIIKATDDGKSGDLYLKAEGITGLGALFGLPQLDTLNDQWIVVDHTLLNSFVADSESVSPTAPTEEDMIEAAEVLGRVSDKYIFSADKADAVLTMREYVGEEKVDGEDTKHFKVGVDESNLKRYLEELGEELDKTKLSKWYDSTTQQSMSEALQLEAAIDAADDLKGSETFDAWVNTDTKMLHKVRFAEAKDAATNYAELVLDYDGGNVVPFAFNVRSTANDTDVTASFKATLNMDSDTVTLSADIKDDAAQTKANGSFDFTVKPGEGGVEADAPADAMTLAEALNALGLTDYFNTLLSGLEASLQSGVDLESL